MQVFLLEFSGVGGVRKERNNLSIFFHLVSWTTLLIYYRISWKQNACLCFLKAFIIHSMLWSKLLFLDYSGSVLISFSFLSATFLSIPSPFHLFAAYCSPNELCFFGPGIKLITVHMSSRSLCHWPKSLPFQMNFERKELDLTISPTISHLWFPTPRR